MTMLALNWPAIGSVVGALGGIGGITAFAKVWLNHRHQMRKATDEVAMTLVERLQVRIEALEARGERIEAEARQERMLCEARLAVQRHKFNNLDMSFDGLLSLIRVAPERAAEFVDDLIAKRQAQRAAEAAEAAQITQAALAAASTPQTDEVHP